MCRDNARAAATFQASDLVWQRLRGTFRRRLRAEGIGEVEAQAFNASFSSYPPSHRKWREYVAHMTRGAPPPDGPSPYWQAVATLADLVAARDGRGLLRRLSPSASEQSGVTVRVGGRLLSWDLLISVDTVLSLLEIVPDLLRRKFVVVDLGQGWGRLGHVLKTLNPSITYVASDIPESLLIAQEYLGRLLPQERLHRYSLNRELTSVSRELLLDGGGMRFCGPQHLDRFQTGAVDVFVNINSFQEMTMPQVTEYFRIIDRVTDGVFYTQQRLRGDVMTRENYPYPVGWRGLFSREVAFSPGYFEAAFAIGSRSTAPGSS